MELICKWEEFYKNVFQQDVDFGEVIIPPKPSLEGCQLLFVAKGLSLDILYTKCEEFFDLDDLEGHSLDALVPYNARISSENYVVWTLNPSKEYVVCRAGGVVDVSLMVTITLLERMLLELKYFVETKKHIDNEVLAYCGGSRSVAESALRALWVSDVEYGSHFVFNFFDGNYERVRDIARYLK